MRNFITKGLLFLTLFLFIGNGIAFLFNHSLNKSSIFKPSFLLNDFSNSNRFDYFILGSSRGLTTLNTTQIDERLNLSGVNLAMDDTDIKTHLLMLTHFYSAGFTSDYCILTLDESSFNKTDNKLGDNDYKFIPFINKDYVQNHFKKYETTRLKPITSSNFFPLLGFSYYNLQLIPSSILSILKPNYRHRFDAKGNYTYPNNKEVHKLKTEKTRKVLEINNPLVEEIKNITAKNGTKLIIYIAPYKNLKIELNSNSNYTIINHSDEIKESIYFYDKIHVNSNGRKLETQQFSNSFQHLLINKN